MNLDQLSVTGTFIHLKGIGPGANQKILDAGLQNWQMALEHSELLPLSKAKISSVTDELKRYSDELQNDNWFNLVAALPAKEHWRVLKDNLHRISYFDIETDGKSMYEGEPTVICCYHRGEMLTYMNGENLDDFPDILDDIDMLTSFNGASFDVPYVQTYFSIPTFPCPHIDLRWICHHKGLKGGLKAIEVELGMNRDANVHGVDGLEAIALWQKWKWYRSEPALERLIHYCRADVMGLEVLAKEISYL
jgi:uncharacterized protein YprB with RNaseH-like and TPR domain